MFTFMLQAFLQWNGTPPRGLKGDFEVMITLYHQTQWPTLQGVARRPLCCCLCHEYYVSHSVGVFSIDILCTRQHAPTGAHLPPATRTRFA